MLNLSYSNHHTLIRFILLIIVSLCIYNADAQYTPQRPFEKVTFQNLNPVYHTTFYDDEFTKLGSDGYNCFVDLKTTEPLIYENLLFSINFNSLESSSTFGNYYITCMNLDNGSVIWRNKVFLNEVPNMEIPRILKINENRQLEIVGQKRISAHDTRVLFTDLIFFKRTYAIEDGAFIALSHRPISDPNAYQMKYQLFETNLFLERPGNTYRIVEKLDIEGRRGFKSFEIDDTGSLIAGPDTLMYVYFDEFVNGVNILPIGIDSLVMMEIGFDDTGDAFIALRYLTYDLEVINEVRIKSPVVENLPYIRLVNISPDNSKILMNVFQLADSQYPEEHTLSLVVDKNGNILNQVRALIQTGPIYDWYSDGNIIHRYSRSDGILKVPIPSYNALFFSTSSEDFKSEIIREYIIEDSTRSANMVKLFRYKDLEIAFFSESAFYLDEFGYERDDVALAFSILAFKKGDFIPEGILSSTKDEMQPIVNSNIKSYPNPSSGPFTLEMQGSKGKADLRIFDMMGRNVYVEFGIKDGMTTFDLSGLPSSAYVYKIYQDGKEIGCGQWIKM
jgi:hypothetical protein